MEKESVLDKVRKLRLVADRSTNQHEAHSALLLAQKLLAQHDLAETEVVIQAEGRSHNPVVTVDALSMGSRTTVWKADLASIIASNLRCEAYLDTVYDAMGDARRTMRFVGRQRDVGVALEVYGMALASADRLCADYIRGRRITPRDAVRSGSTLSGLCRRLRTAFFDGFVVGLRARFQQQLADDTTMALVLVPDAEVRAEVGKLNLRTSRATYRDWTDGKAYEAGHRAGQSFDHAARPMPLAAPRRRLRG